MRATDGSKNGPVTAWLLGANERLPIEVHNGQITRFHASMLISVAAALNTILVSCAIAWRIPTAPFILWAAIELTLGFVRMAVLIAGRRTLLQRRLPPIGRSIALAICSSASVGYGVFLCLASQQWAVSTLGCLSAAAMAGGICLRYYPMPRLVAVIILLSLGPCVAAALLSGEPILLVVALQLPLYAATMAAAALQLNKAMVRALIAEQENDRRAHHDSLTGLLNRAGLARAMKRRTAKGDDFALLYLDLDRFKAVNDSFGHQAGDALLKSVAERLRNAASPDDAIARIGGDEFVILASVTGLAGAKAVGERFVAAVNGHGFVFDKQAALVGASIGIALCPEHGRDLGPLLGEADAALHQAKYSGRGRCVVAGTGMIRAAADDLKPLSCVVAQSGIVHDKAA